VDIGYTLDWTLDTISHYTGYWTLLYWTFGKYRTKWPTLRCLPPSPDLVRYPLGWNQLWKTDDRPSLRSKQGTTFHRHSPSCPTRQQEGYQDVSQLLPSPSGEIPLGPCYLVEGDPRGNCQGKRDHANHQREEDFRQVHHPRGRWILPLREASYGVVEELKGQEG